MVINETYAIPWKLIVCPWESNQLEDEKYVSYWGGWRRAIVFFFDVRNKARVPVTMGTHNLHFLGVESHLYFFFTSLESCSWSVFWISGVESDPPVMILMSVLFLFSSFENGRLQNLRPDSCWSHVWFKQKDSNLFSFSGGTQPLAICSLSCICICTSRWMMTWRHFSWIYLEKVANSIPCIPLTSERSRMVTFYFCFIRSNNSKWVFPKIRSTPQWMVNNGKPN